MGHCESLWLLRKTPLPRELKILSLGKFGALPDDIGVGIDSEVLSGQIALLEIQQEMIQAAIDQARPARPKLKTA